MAVNHSSQTRGQSIDLRKVWLLSANQSRFTTYFTTFSARKNKEKQKGGKTAETVWAKVLMS